MEIKENRTNKIIEEANSIFSAHMENKDSVALLERYFFLIKKAAYLGNAEAQFSLGILYEDEERIKILRPNEKKTTYQKRAFYWYKKASENGHSDAFLRYADCLSDGIGCKQDIDLAIKLYNIAIEKGWSAYLNLATVYRDKQDFEQAFNLYKKAQELDKADSLRIALCYYYGVGTTEDKGKAKKIFQFISERKIDTPYEIDEANYYLGRIYLEGKIVNKSLEKARHYLELANKDNDHNSANELLLIIGRNP
ncbi:MAG: sel1 repeat family protein [Flavobacteriaceae bacterium]|jgi:TPR repeat protein|nr:sel1 repeat family protein [Flavobacteriaceae bacterium]